MHNNHMMRPNEEMQPMPAMQQPRPNHSASSWQCPGIPNVPGYGKPNSSSHQYSLQMEMRQVIFLRLLYWKDFCFIANY